MDSIQVGVFKKANQIGLTCLLKSTNSCTLEAQICFEVLSNFPHQTLEGKFANQKLSGLQIMSNFTECHSTRPVMMRFLHPSSRGRTLESCFCSELLLLYHRWICGQSAFCEPWYRDLLTSPVLLRLELGELEVALALESDGGAAAAANTITFCPF